MLIGRVSPRAVMYLTYPVERETKDAELVLQVRPAELISSLPRQTA